MILRQDEISENISTIGAKTINLKKLVDYNFLVPEFIAISSDNVIIIDKNEAELKKICQIIQKEFPKNEYAIRSSSIIEDQNESSMAGQFHTEIKVFPSELEFAIKKVIDQSKDILKDDMSKFSIIIQEYIEASYSWVCFTRNPNGQREMIIEYHKWIGEDMVSGKIIPIHEVFYWNENKKICGFDTNIFKIIENKFWFPQDIEWCIKNNTLYILQTRPITTISQNKYSEILFLEKELTKGKDYFYEKTEISEVAPRPTPFTYSLLEKIYSEDGPIMNVYKKHTVDYSYNNFLKIIWNELFIDRNLELKTLLPAFDLLNKNYSPKINSFKNIWRTVNNIFFTIWIKEDKNIIKQLQEALQANEIWNDYKTALSLFLKNYAIIFEVNIMAAKFLKKVEILLKNEKINISEILWMDPWFFCWDFLETQEFQFSKNFIWNTLEISDEGEFYSILIWKNNTQEIIDWWQKLPDWKKNLYSKPIFNAIIYQKYREYARILMIKNLNILRWNVLWYATEFNNPKNIYFHTITEIEKLALNEEVCVNRKKHYDKYNIFNFPNKLSYNLKNEKKINTGISSGKTEGYLVTEDTIDTILGQKILYTNILSPMLTKYFTQINGIVSENGWLLSHLAIIAREQKIPIIIIWNTKNIQMWDYVEINWSNGEYKILSKK